MGIWLEVSNQTGGTIQGKLERCSRRPGEEKVAETPSDLSTSQGESSDKKDERKIISAVVQEVMKAIGNNATEYINFTGNVICSNAACHKKKVDTVTLESLTLVQVITSLDLESF